MMEFEKNEEAMHPVFDIWPIEIVLHSKYAISFYLLSQLTLDTYNTLIGADPEIVSVKCNILKAVLLQKAKIISYTDLCFLISFIYNIHNTSFINSCRSMAQLSPPPLPRHLSLQEMTNRQTCQHHVGAMRGPHCHHLVPS